ncbi:MAG: SBBP repeat-containing protein [Dehalococcoidia bacterium]|nr:SBBP repeat-containing protein [Dehalococcoidia bacterium]
MDDIQLSLSGIERLDMKGGDLILQTACGDFKQERLRIFQETGSVQKDITGSFALLSDVTYGFNVADYDTGHDLIIDPSLVYSTYLGGALNDCCFALAADAAGCVYAAGYAASADFPVKAGFQMVKGPNVGDAWIAKIDTSKSGATSLVYCTYLGGSLKECAIGLAIDAGGFAYVVGNTQSSDFPTRNSMQPAMSGEVNIYIAKLNTAGNDLVYSTYLGGSGFDFAQGIEIDMSGCVYITGATSSANFPMMNPYQGQSAGQSDAFITKVASDGQSLIYSTYLGGSGLDSAVDIAVDNATCAYVFGVTASLNFPTLNPALTHRGNLDVFITKLNATGSSLVYSTYIGGSGYDGFKGVDEVNFGGIAVDTDGRAYIAGMTNSTDFPTVNAYQTVKSTGFDAFLTRLSSSGSIIEYSTYLGGDNEDTANDVAVDAAACAYIAGSTRSSDFPLKYPFQYCIPYGGGVEDNVFICKIDTAKSGADSLKFSTFLGGSNFETSLPLFLDQTGYLYTGGYILSWDLPIKNACQPLKANTNSVDAFISKIDIAEGNNPPNIPSNPSPALLASSVPITDNLSWSGGDPDGDSVMYDVYLSRCHGWAWQGSPPEWAFRMVSCNQTGTLFPLTLAVPPVEAATRYSWKIVARDSHGAEALGPQWTFFTTTNPPQVTAVDATNIQQEGPADNITYRATLSANLTSLGSYPGALGWFNYVNISGDGYTAFSTPLQTITNTGVFTTDIHGLLPGKKYTWSVWVVPPGKTACDCASGGQKSFFTGVPTLTGLGAINTNATSGTLNNVVAVSEATLPNIGKPTVTFPYGLLSYSITDIPVGSTVNFILTYPSNIPITAEYWKYDEATGWVNITSLVGHNDGDNILTIALTDGGPGDSDGVANGTIVDPGGVALPLQQQQPQAGQVNRVPGAHTATQPPSHSSTTTAPPTQPVAIPNVLVQTASISSSRVAPGAPVSIVATVVNKSTVNGAAKIKLYVNGEEVDNQVVAVESGKIRTVDFTVSRSKPGTYRVYVGSISAGSFVVDELADPNLILYISLALIFSSFVLGIIYTWRKLQYRS